jgi:hypothetical protein
MLHDPWDSIWNSDLFVSFRDRELDPRGYGLPEKCWECPDLPLCGGGCRIEREARDGHRISEDGDIVTTSGGSGGGCAGCSGACGTRSHVSHPVFAPTAGFIPVEGLTSPARRGQGQMPAFIPIAEIGEYTQL